MIEFLFVLFCGLAFGSFITCASYRLPLGIDVVKKPSHCPACSAKLTSRDLWPLFSWLLSGGKCRHCQAPVSIRYPLTELATAGVFLLIYWRWGFTLPALVLCLAAVALLIMVVVDLEHYIIPDSVHLALAPLALAWHVLANTPREDMISGFLTGLFLGLGLHYGYRLLRKKDGLGFGDVKFLAVAGLWMGFLAIPPFLFMAGILGIATGLLWRVLKRGPVFPFGPALAVSLFICVAFPEIPSLFWSTIRVFL